jgi:ABC-2 type transport system permease protein
VKGFIRSLSRIVGTLIEPLMYLVILGIGLTPVFKRAGDANYFSFLVPGVIGTGLLFNSLFGGMELIRDRQTGLIKETLVAPTSRLVILIGHTLGVTTVALAQGVIVGLVCAIAGFRYPGLLGIAQALGFASLIAFIFSMIGLSLGSVTDDAQGLGKIVNFIVTPLVFTSGSVFPLEGQGAIIRDITDLNPMTYGSTECVAR